MNYSGWWFYCRPHCLWEAPMIQTGWEPLIHAPTESSKVMHSAQVDTRSRCTVPCPTEILGRAGKGQMQLDTLSLSYRKGNHVPVALPFCRAIERAALPEEQKELEFWQMIWDWVSFFLGVAGNANFLVSGGLGRSWHQLQLLSLREEGSHIAHHQAILRRFLVSFISPLFLVIIILH